MSEETLACQDHPYYQQEDELLITRDLEVTGRLPCTRTLLPRTERWPTHHIGGHLGRTRNGTLYALLTGSPAAQRWISEDDGLTWKGEELDLPALGAFAILNNDTFLAAAGGGEEPIRILSSPDRGRTWKSISTLSLSPFDAMHVDSNLFQLRDGTTMLAANMRIDPPAGEPFANGHYPQYLFHSSDRGKTWETGIDPEFWQAVRAGRESIADEGSEYTWPGPFGTFPGVYETGFCELDSGLLVGAFRFSGPPRPWHHRVIAQWGEPPDEPDAHGRIFRHVVLGESPDKGRSWQHLRPILDAAGTPLMAHGESNGELVQLPDGRLVLVHQTRYAEGPDRERGYFRGRSQLCARVSLDAGQTWLPERYRLLFGFGYSSTLALEDDTLITAVGASLGDNGDPRRGAIIRWRLKD